MEANTENRAIAMAALFQCVDGVSQVANTGNIDTYLQKLQENESQQKILLYFKSELRNILETDLKEELIEQKHTNIKALYYTAYASARTSKIDDFLDIAKNTEVNALIIDIKEID